jgi:hypothetical protein
MKHLNYVLICIIPFLYGCADELKKLTPPDERVVEATSSLIKELSAPENGWILNYQPTAASGSFYILLKFDEDGNVHIQSDVPQDDQKYFDHTIHYRVDAVLSIELIFETYGVFHYLFEQNQSTFGAEFQFHFVEKEGDHLIFASKSDFSADDLTMITLVPASADSDQAFSRDLAENMLKYDTLSSLFIQPIQHLAFSEQNISVFWSVNLAERSINVRDAAVGLTLDEITSNDLSVDIQHQTGYTFIDDKMLLTTPFSFSLNGANYTISELSLSSFSESGPVLCAASTLNTPVYTGTSIGLGNVSMYKTLYDVKGRGFVPQEERPYGVNVLFVISDDLFSISESGSINDYFPNAGGFVFNYGFIDDEQPAYAVGLDLTLDTGERSTILREFEMVNTIDNRVQVVFRDTYYPATMTTEEQQHLEEVTNEIFGVGGGEIHAALYPVDGQPDLEVYSLYNPCNGYEFLLVK